MDWGFGSCVFVNLFAYRTPYPVEMKRAADPVGPDNDRHILEEAEQAGKIVIAWGNHGFHRGRYIEVLDLLRKWPLFCLGTTKLRQPLHPLYLSKDSVTEPW